MPSTKPAVSATGTGSPYRTISPESMIATRPPIEPRQRVLCPSDRPTLWARATRGRVDRPRPVGAGGGGGEKGSKQRVDAEAGRGGVVGGYRHQSRGCSQRSRKAVSEEHNAVHGESRHARCTAIGADRQHLPAEA